MSERRHRNAFETGLVYVLITLAMIILWALIAPILADIATLLGAVANWLARLIAPERSSNANDTDSAGVDR